MNYDKAHPTEEQDADEEITGGIVPQKSVMPNDDTGRTLQKIVIINSRDIEGTTYYLVRIQSIAEGDSGRTDEQYLKKRYSDFQRLDNALRKVIAETPWGEAAPLAFLPALPDSGVLGLRHKLGVGEFMTRRQEGLQKYLDYVLSQVKTKDDQPALKAFLSSDHVDMKRVQDAKYQVPDAPLQEEGTARAGKRGAVSVGLPGGPGLSSTRAEGAEGQELQKLTIVSCREGTPTFYLICVEASGEEWYLGKRYTDFQRVDGVLRTANAERSRNKDKVLNLPDLPEKGRLGLRKMMGVGDFNEKRKQGLQNYLDVLTEQILAVNSVPGLEEFLGSGMIARERVLEAKFQVPDDWGPKVEDWTNEAPQDSDEDDLSGFIASELANDGKNR